MQKGHAVNIKESMENHFVYRGRQEVSDVLYTKSLSCYPPENEAAKIFVDFLEKHPEYSAKDINIRIDSEEIEEDHYGNGGGYEHTAVIFKLRNETDKERSDRIHDDEDILINTYSYDIRNLTYKLLGKLNVDAIPMEERGQLLKRVYKQISVEILKEITDYCPLDE